MVEFEVKQCGTVFGERLVRRSHDGIAGHFLTGATSETGLYYTINKGQISIWRFGRVSRLADCFFGDEAEVVGACYVPFKDGSEGVVIAVNDYLKDPSISFLAYYSIAEGKIIKKIKLRKTITCICTVLDNTKSKEMSEIHANLRSSPHLLAVGTEDACCYLVHFGISTTDEYDATFTYAPFATDICKHHKSDNKFKIRSVNAGMFDLRTDAIYVTSLLYIEICKLIVVGLSCGAFVTVSLHNARSDVYYFSKGSVFSIAYQQANDDPHPVIYLWFAHSAVKSGRSLSSRAHRPQIVLVRVDFPNDEKSDLLTTPFIQQPHLMWYPDKCSRWLSFRTIFQSDSFERSAIGYASSSSSTSLESRSPICEGLSRHTSGVDSTLLLMTWIDESTANAEGALFDLNAFYYKRLVQRVLFDSTIAHQNAFISRFTLANPKQIQFGLPLDVVANASSITRFGSVFSDTNDALFYPSTLTFSLNVITATHTYTISIHSIQEEVLNYAELHIDKVMNCRPNTVSEWISAVGLANANSTVTINSENAETSLVVSALIYHQRGRALKKWIETTSNINARNRLAKQLWDEVEYAKSRFDELSSPLFGSLSTDLSRPAIVSMGGIVSLLTITKTLFASIATKTDAVNDAEKAEFECHHRASSNLALYSQLVLFLWKRQLLPEMNGFRKVREQMQKNYERCDAVARQNGETLWIDSLLSEMQSVSSDEAFWMSDGSTPWYPPRSILTLLAPVLVLQIMDVAKYKLIGYFLLDYDNAETEPSTVFDAFKYTFIQNCTQLIEQINEKWKRDHDHQMEGTPKMNEYVDTIRTSEEAPQDLETLMECSFLNDKQIDFIRDQLLSTEDGVVRWNAFCLQRKYFSRLIAPNGQPKDEQWKTECDRWTTRVMAMLPYKSDIQLPQAVLDKWQENVTSKMATYHLRRSLTTTETDRKRLSLHSAVIDSRVFPNRKRISTENPSADLNAPEVSRRRLNRDGNENSPVLDDRAARLEEALPEEEMESIRRVLQTPPSRRRMMLSNRAVFVDSPMTSPIASSLSIPAPTSILKSNRRKDVINPDNEQGSEPRPRLRFHLPSSHTNSSTDSPLSESNLIQSSEMKQSIPQQPDFNYESDDDEEEEHELEDSVIVLEDEDSKKVLADIVHPTADDSMGIVAEGTEAVVMSEENSSVKNRSYEEQSDESGDENEERESEKVESKERKGEEIPEEIGDDSNDNDRAKRILSVINSGFDMQDDSLNSMKISQSERQPIGTTKQKIVYYEEQEWEDDIEVDGGENRLIEQKSPIEATQQQSSSGEDSIISRSFEEQAEEDVVDEEEEGEDRSKKDTLKKCADNDDTAPPSKTKHDDIAEHAMNVDVDDQSNLDYHHAVTYQVIEENTECDSAKQQSFEEQQWACAQVIDDLDHMQYTETATVTVSTIQREQTYESRVGVIEEQHEEEDDMRQESDKGQQAASQSQLTVIETTQRHQQFSDAIPDEDRKRIEKLRKMAMQLEQKKHKRPIDSQSHGAILLEARRDEQGPKNTADMASSSLAKSSVVDQSEQLSLSKSVRSVSKTDVVEAATIESTGVSEQVEPQRDLLEVRPAASTRKIARGASEKPSSPPSHRRTSRRRTHSENQSTVSLSSSPVRTPVKKSTRSRGGVSTELERTKEMPELNKERNAFEAEITPPAMQDIPTIQVTEVESKEETLPDDPVAFHTRSASRARSPACAKMDTETTEPVTPTRRRTTRASSQDKSGNATHLTTEFVSRSTRRRLQLTSSTDDSESAAFSERAVSPSRSRKRTNSKSQSQDVEQSAMMSASDTPTSRSSSRLSRRSSVSRNTSPARAITDVESGEPTTPTRRRKRASSNQSSQEVDEAQIEQSSTASGRRTRASAKVVESQVDEPVTPARRSTRASSSVSRDNRSSSPATSSIQHRSPSRRSSRSSSIASISRSSVSEDTMSVTSQKRGRRSTHSPAVRPLSPIPESHSSRSATPSTSSRTAKRRATPRKRVSKNTRAENSVSPARSPAAKSRRATSLTIPSSPSTSSSSSSAAISKTPTKTTRSSKKGRRRSVSESVAAAAELKAPKTRKIQIRAGRKTIAEIEEERNARTHTLRMTPTRLKKIFDE